MIPLREHGWQSQPWQWHLSHAVRDSETLLTALRLPSSSVDTPFPVLVPWPYLAAMTPGDPDDPLLRQVLPLRDELDVVVGYVTDPLDEQTKAPIKGVLHKYEGRVLVITTAACAIHCRYCFRRHFPYDTFRVNKSDWQNIVGYIRSKPDIREVILSGGDHLVANDKLLSWIAHQLASIDHVDTLRLHTRLPVVVPQRVCPELVEWISKTTLKVVVVIHANHANEITQQVTDAAHRLTRAGTILLNQSVLLKDINDDVDNLSDLSRRLFHAGVLPYYLHLLDPVTGTHHFEVPADDGRDLLTEMSRKLPGYLVPKLVRELPGAGAKESIPLNSK